MDVEEVLPFLDGIEERFQKQVLDFILSENYLAELVLRVKTPTDKNTTNGKEILSKMFEAHMLEAFIGGFKHGQDEVAKAKAFFKKKFAETSVEITPSEEVIPESVLAWYATYAIYLSNIFDEDVLKKAKGIIEQSLEEGLHYKDVIKLLQKSEEFSNFAKGRLKTIALTETTKGYNMGRLEQFKSSEGYVQAVQYSAVLDKRTTPLCRSLHGKIMSLDNPLVRVYLPPNHFNCRSIILPVTKYDTWKESDFSNVPRPQNGFDNLYWTPAKK